MPSQKLPWPPVELELASVVPGPVLVPPSLTAPVVPELPPLVVASLVVAPVPVASPPLEPLTEPALVLALVDPPPSDVVGAPCVASPVEAAVVTDVLDALAVPAPESPHATVAASITTQPPRPDLVMVRSLRPHAARNTAHAAAEGVVDPPRRTHPVTA
jgi:hypothetical protein